MYHGYMILTDAKSNTGEFFPDYNCCKKKCDLNIVSKRIWFLV